VAQILRVGVSAEDERSKGFWRGLFEWAEGGLSEDNSPEADKDCGEDMPEASTPGLHEDQRRLEMLKLQFEWQKHLSTLTSGITLLVTTVSYTVFRDTVGDPHPFATTWVGINKLLVGAFVLFLFGFLWSLFGMRRVIKWCQLRVRDRA
jgi:hypothetical protein